jgi:hypothetical protein
MTSMTGPKNHGKDLVVRGESHRYAREDVAVLLGAVRDMLTPYPTQRCST